ncbi:hypothetical protein BJ878DRAFT_529285 [Calycina marina]|uniref:Uncharacterized protein n=1 Tax=Calycina marina TaxID=1763456 RepID=A0A9P7YVE9_9HELO|nr:hypothetical protein BJ878DRAFT_529285 [Calycina marina]
MPSEIPKPDVPSAADSPGAGEEPSQKTKDKIISEISNRLKAAEEAQDGAAELRERSGREDEEEVKEQLLFEAREMEKKAQSELKIVRRLESGVWQGGASGAGIGGGIAAGIGTTIGAIVGGVVGIPTTGLGLLIGAGTGAIHGPWVKITGKGDDLFLEKGDGEDDASAEKD